MTKNFEPETIGGRLARVAARLPGKLAIAEKDARVTFGQLDAAASAIARRILVAGRDRPGFVGLLYENKVSAVKAIFGAARSGRAYVPLDAGDPDERLRFILQDSEPVALLTEASLLERARALASSGCAVIDIAGLESDDEAKSLPGVTADTPAYVFYTSGSTGQPKGVGQTHGNLLFFADAYAKTLRIDAADRLTFLFSLSFGAATMDIFGGLFSGATLCGYDMRRDGIPLLADWLDRERITVLHAVPTVFRELFSSLAPDRKLAHLRAIDLGGEAVFDSDVELFRRHTVERCIFVNHLAATEAHVIAQHVVEHRGPRPSAGILPAGRSPQGLRVLIQRDDGSEADTSEAGAIVVSSPHVSPGYWRRPELDAAAFSADPVAPGWRRYFTGDLGRIDGEGNLHFLGRSGSRVKIRGHTVELTEIEAALSAYPGVTKVAVLALNGELQSGPDRLVAYLGVSQEVERNPLLVRRRLAQRLPSYMLPTAFLFMDALPLTASGKIDRKALAAMEPPPEAAQAREIEPPADDLERAIAGIFQQMLKLAPIGRGDDFFLLGGDSLSVVELQTRLRDTFGVGLANPHEDATVAGVAADIRRNRATALGATQPIPVLIPLRRRGSAPPLFLVHGRLGQALVSPHFLRLLGADQSVWAFQARGLDGLQEPHSTIEAMAADYVNEMRKQRPEGPYFLGALCAGALIAIAMARTLRDAGEPVLPLLLLDPPERPFPMADSRMTERGLLARLRLRRALGRIDAPIDDPVYARASVRAAKAFEHAIRTHKAQPYDGPVCMLCSHDRMATIEPSQLTKVFTGRVERFEVARSHAEILDARNLAFAKALARCMTIIHESAKVHGVLLTR
jgi:amino acid adenylation domain-containing protein